MFESNLINLVNSEETNVNLIVKKAKPRKKVLLGWDEDTLSTIKKESESELKTNISNGKYSVATSFIINSAEASVLVNKVFCQKNQLGGIWTSHLTPREVLSLMVYAINISCNNTSEYYGKNVSLQLPANAFYKDNFGGWRKALELVGLTKNNIKLKSKVIDLSKDQLFITNSRGVNFAISRGTKKHFWGSDLIPILKKSINPKLKSTIAGGKYSIYSDFIITPDEAESLSSLCVTKYTNWHYSLTPKEILSLLAYAINISGFSTSTKYRNDVPLKIPHSSFYSKQFGSWSNTLALLGLTEN